MTTKAAFKKLISERGVNRLLGITSENVRYLRFALKKEGVTLNKMEEILKKAGYLKTPESWIKEVKNPGE